MLKVFVSIIALTVSFYAKAQSSDANAIRCIWEMPPEYQEEGGVVREGYTFRRGDFSIVSMRDRAEVMPEVWIYSGEQEIEHVEELAQDPVVKEGIFFGGRRTEAGSLKLKVFIGEIQDGKAVNILTEDWDFGVMQTRTSNFGRESLGRLTCNRLSAE